MDEAHDSVKDLSSRVEQVLAENQEMSQRLRNLESQSRTLRSAGVSSRYSVTEMDDSGSISTTRSQINDRAKLQNITYERKFGFTFEKALHESPVYNRALRRHSNLSLPSSAMNSLGWSFLSGISIAQVSNISVISLPISVNELWNSQHYRLKIDHLIPPRAKLPSLPEKGHMTAKCLLLGMYFGRPVVQLVVS